MVYVVNVSFKLMDWVYGKFRIIEGLNCSFVLEMVNNFRVLCSEMELLLFGKMVL